MSMSDWFTFRGQYKFNNKSFFNINIKNESLSNWFDFIGKYKNIPKIKRDSKIQYLNMVDWYIKNKFRFNKPIDFIWNVPCGTKRSEEFNKDYLNGF